MHCIVNAYVARLLWPAPFLLSRGQEVGTEGADVVGGCSIERRWRREERRRSGEFPPLVISLFLLLGHTLTESKTSGESETENECVHVWQRKRTSLNECTLIHQHDKERSCCIHGLFPYVVARYVSRASVRLPGWSLLSCIEMQGRLWSSDREGQRRETERKSCAKLNWNSKMYYELNFIVSVFYSRNRNVYVTVLCRCIQTHYFISKHWNLQFCIV